MATMVSIPRHVREVLAKLLDSFVSVGRLGDHPHVGLIINDGADPFAHQRMIIDAEDANLSRFAHFFCSTPRFGIFCSAGRRRHPENHRSPPPGG
jgi:hypothetical protein